MQNIIQFLLDLLKIFFDGITSIVMGLVNGIIGIFNLPEYFNVFSKYSGSFVWWEWCVAIFFLILILGVLIGLVWLVIHFTLKIVRRIKTNVKPQDLIDQISKLHKELNRVNKEKERILGIKMKNAGSRYNEDLGGVEGEDSTVNDAGEPRFSKLMEIDAQYQDFIPEPYDDIDLKTLCERFRNYAASQHKLYYELRVIRLFFASFATTRLVILQGISGTGKTSLPYAIGQFLNNPATITPVQPSWRDRTELFGYFNEFTKRFNETEVLKRMYEATYTDEVYLTVLDEMNIARVEYYFAEMLSILEMPSRESWVIDIVPSGWSSDPKHIVKGRFKLPENMWYIGTANNDDSTFAISDKVYDRAMPININDKGRYFSAPKTEKVHLSATSLEQMYRDAQLEFKVSEENLEKIEDLDNYVIEHFRLAFGNRIVKQLKEFVPAYIACGGSELDGLDYVLTNKILRKFESLNLSYIRDEIDGLVDYLDRLFGKPNMQESKEYLIRLKKLY